MFISSFVALYVFLTDFHAGIFSVLMLSSHASTAVGEEDVLQVDVSSNELR